jgi:pimeloyl-ACP methyl ester carboxylesterase
MCDARLFGPQIAAFSPERPVLVGDFSIGSTIADFANDVLDMAPEKFALAGLSMGGIVAMEIMRIAPERVDRLALMDTNPLPEPEEVALYRDGLINRAQAGELGNIVRDDLKPNYLADGPNIGPVMDMCFEMAQDLGPDVFVRQSIALKARTDQQGTLANITVPTLILCGREDKLCPMERHLLMHSLVANSKFALIEKAGHIPTLEAPEDTNKELYKWLNM